jgi:hypothetical protein
LASMSRVTPHSLRKTHHYRFWLSREGWAWESAFLTSSQVKTWAAVLQIITNPARQPINISCPMCLLLPQGHKKTMFPALDKEQVSWFKS